MGANLNRLLLQRPSLAFDALIGGENYRPEEDPAILPPRVEARNGRNYREPWAVKEKTPSITQQWNWIWAFSAPANRWMMETASNRAVASAPGRLLIGPAGKVRAMAFLDSA
jgi:hypothetical protein